MSSIVIDKYKLKEECGVFGIINSENAFDDIYLGLHSLQHRGQEASGIVTFDDNGNEHFVKKVGSVISSFNSTHANSLQGHIGLGHVRYSTFGSSSLLNIQPFIFKTHKITYATCHNGNLVNALELKTKLEKAGSVFFSDSDSEIIGHLINHSKKEKFLDKIIDALSKMEGAFSYIILTKDKMYGCRDKNGIRPLCLGIRGDNTYIFASETVALDIAKAKFIREIKPGEIVEIDLKGNISSSFYVSASKIKSNFCAMEYIYFLRPDSYIQDNNVHKVRVNLGKQLAKEHPVDADVVIGVPDSSLSSAIGYSQKSKIPYDIGLIKNRYVARSFILTHENRENVVKIKLNPNAEVLRGKRVILVDDSIVRGTTMGIITKLIHDAGAKELHIRIASPELRWPCFYGVDIKTRKELSLASQNKEEYLKYLKYADSLEFLSLQGLESAIGLSSKKNQLCTACFTGKYITDLFSNKK